MMKIKPGARILIVGDHPWTGHSGEIVDIMKTMMGSMWKVRLDNGMECGAKDRNIKETPA